MLGITKAYTTRVGRGPFPTELRPTPDVGEHLSQRRPGVRHRDRPRRAAAAGSTPRCCKRSVQINGVSGLCMTKLDVLDGLESCKLCIGYKLDGEHVDILPVGADEIGALRAGLRRDAGLDRDAPSAPSRWTTLPANARAYLSASKQLVGVPIDMVSTGPDRDHTIVLRHPFAA